MLMVLEVSLVCTTAHARRQAAHSEALETMALAPGTSGHPVQYTALDAAPLAGPVYAAIRSQVHHFVVVNVPYRWHITPDLKAYGHLR